MRIKTELVAEKFKQKYNLHDKIHKGFVYLEIRRGCYGLPQAGVLANNLLKKSLAIDRYYEVPHTPSLWRNEHRPVQFTLVVDDFSVKYTGDEHFKHLVQTLQNTM